MSTFLNALCKSLLNTYGQDLSQLTLVFPTRRASLFFQRELAALSDQPVWSPAIFSIQDFIAGLSTRTVPDQLTLLFELYRVYRQHFPEETFDNFYSWGELMLKDFDDLDKYLADADKVFSLISDIRQLEEDFNLPEEELNRLRQFWEHFFKKNPSRLQSEFLQTWKFLASIYRNFKQALEEKEFAYEGMLQREVALNLSNVADFGNFAEKPVVFAGFYALTPAEELIIAAFCKHKNAKLFRDADSYYLNDAKQEAGSFFRQGILSDPEIPWTGNYFREKKRNIEISAVPLSVGQAKYAGELIRKWMQEPDFRVERTAIVLPDEQLLFPVLYSLPEELKDINVTMGYPLRHSPLYALLELLIALERNIRKDAEGNPTYYFKDVLGLLQHPYVRRIEATRIQRWLTEYSKDRKIRIAQSELQKGLPADLHVFFRTNTTVENRFEWIKLILLQILQAFQESSEGKNLLEGEFVLQFHSQIVLLQEIISKENIELSAEHLWSLIKESIQSAKIPFSGEPVKGLQIMGFLETRVLDFDRIILLSVNEDYLPASGNRPSFIPYNVRKAFRLPTYEDQHAVSAYHFYRLLQRPSVIHLIHNTETKALSGGEPSRFLLQLEHEVAVRNPETVFIQKNIVTTPVVHHQVKSIEIKKDETVLSLLRNFIARSGESGEKIFSRKFSASSLSSYISCSLKFYFRYIAGLDEQDETEENMEAATFGKVLHHAMMLVYQDEQEVRASQLEYFRKKLLPALEKAILEEYADAGHLEGKNILLKEVLLELMERILLNDIQDAPFTIHALEKEFTLSMGVDSIGEIAFKGIIDRIDESEQGVRLLDYKTGRVEKRKAAATADLFINPKLKEQFQAFLYLSMVKDIYADKSLRFALVTLREMGAGPWYLSGEEPVNVESILDFQSGLKSLLNELFDPAIPFKQTDDPERCVYCPYKGICQREG